VPEAAGEDRHAGLLLHACGADAEHGCPGDMRRLQKEMVHESELGI